jgi:hypothetical protein
MKLSSRFDVSIAARALEELYGVILNRPRT